MVNNFIDKSTRNSHQSTRCFKNKDSACCSTFCFFFEASSFWTCSVRASRFFSNSFSAADGGMLWALRALIFSAWKLIRLAWSGAFRISKSLVTEKNRLRGFHVYLLNPLFKSQILLQDSHFRKFMITAKNEKYVKNRHGNDTFWTHQKAPDTFSRGVY